MLSVRSCVQVRRLVFVVIICVILLKVSADYWDPLMRSNVFYSVLRLMAGVKESIGMNYLSGVGADI